MDHRSPSLTPPSLVLIRCLTTPVFSISGKNKNSAPPFTVCAITGTGLFFLLIAVTFSKPVTFLSAAGSAPVHSRILNPPLIWPDIIKSILIPVHALTTYCNHVKPYRNAFSQPLIIEVIIRHTAYFLLFSNSHCLRRITGVASPSVFHFEKDKIFPVPADQIHFSLTASEILFRQPYPFFLQIYAGGLFIGFPDFSSIHWLSLIHI